MCWEGVILFLILACDVLFWTFFVGGLAARYPAGWRILGGALLLCVPGIAVSRLNLASSCLRELSSDSMRQRAVRSHRRAAVSPDG